MTHGAHLSAWALLIGVAACTSHSAKDDAMSLCRKAARGERVVSATKATVGEVRTLTYGPGNQPARNAFAGAGDGAAAAWCWVPAGSSWHSYAAGPSAERVDLVTVSVTTAPSGAPSVP